MSYLRPFELQPKPLSLSAQDAWLIHIFHQILDQRILSRTTTVLEQSYVEEDCFQALYNYEATLIKHKEWQKSLVVETECNRPSASDYLDNLLPRSMQEDLFHHGAQLLKKKEVYFDMFPTFFSLFWRAEFKLLNLPLVQNVQERLDVLDHLLSVCEKKMPLTESAKFRLLDKQEKLSLEESYVTKRVLRTFANIKVLVLWKICDDAMLHIVGNTCHHLEALDLWRSTSVTDMGIKFLLNLDTDATFQDVVDNKSRLCESLVRIVVKETSCTHIGSLFLIIHCANLEILDFSHGAIVKEFLANVCHIHKQHKTTFALKTLFLPVTSSEYLHDIANSFPYLEDLRLWTSMSHITGLCPSDFPMLNSLMLGGLQSSTIMKNLVVALGQQLATLKIETVLTTVPLHIIGQHCPNLVELQVINARLATRDHKCGDNVNFFSKLKLVYFFLIHYKTNNNYNDNSGKTKSGLHCVLNHAKLLEAIQATGASTFTDECLDKVLQVNPLKNLRRFILTDTSVLEEPLAASPSLTAQSVLKLFEACPKLQCIGDLRHWAIPPSDRRRMFKQIHSNHGCRWVFNHEFEYEEMPTRRNANPVMMIY